MTKKLVAIVQNGLTLKGSPCFFIDEIEGDGLNVFGVEVEPGEHLTGFFHTAKEAGEAVVWQKY